MEIYAFERALFQHNELKKCTQRTVICNFCLIIVFVKQRVLNQGLMTLMFWCFFWITCRFLEVQNCSVVSHLKTVYSLESSLKQMRVDFPIIYRIFWTKSGNSDSRRLTVEICFQTNINAGNTKLTAVQLHAKAPSQEQAETSPIPIRVAASLVWDLWIRFSVSTAEAGEEGEETQISLP